MFLTTLSCAADYNTNQSAFQFEPARKDAWGTMAQAALPCGHFYL